MRAFEFQTTIGRKYISIPGNLHLPENAEARIIVLLQEDKPPQSQKEVLRKLFLQIKAKNLFSKINDPVKWQKQIRNEWERTVR